MSFPRYGSYKDSGVEWLGEVPSHWKVPKLKRSATFAGGGTPSRDKPEFWNGQVPWVSPKDMKSEELSDTEEHLSSLGLAASAASLVRPGAVLMVVRSGILRHTIPVAINLNSVALNQDMKAILFDPEQCLPWFFLRWVQGFNTALINAICKQGATVESIEHDYLRELQFPLPPRTEQAAIAAFLDRETAKIDALVEEQRRLIALLAEKRQAVISHAVTKGLDPTVPMKDSGVEWLGEVPAHWQVKRIKWAARMASGHTPDKKIEAYWIDGSIPWVSLQDTSYLKNNEYISETAQYVTEIGIQNSSARILPPRVVVFSRDATIGRCAITAREMAVSQHFIAWECGECLLPEFLLYCFRSMAQELEKLTFGATVKTIGMPDVRSLSIAIPPYENQVVLVRHIREMISKIDDELALSQSSITLLQERRAALISAAVTGKIDVRGLVPAVEEAA